MKTGTITQRIPNFVDGVEPKVRLFNSLTELLETEFVKVWSKHKAFFRYSLADGAHPTLMYEENKGKRWWVIGFIDKGDVDLSKLPIWRYKK